MIGIIGGYGEVGHHACMMLQKWGKQSLKIGGRNPEKGKELYGNVLPDARWEKVDVTDKDSIASFITGCELVLNCAAPSSRYSRTVAPVSYTHLTLPTTSRV